MAKKEHEESILPKRSQTDFDDIIGHQHIKERLKAIVKIFTNPAIVDQFKISPPKGMLIYGPPSVGKSMLAKMLIEKEVVESDELIAMMGKQNKISVLPATL